MNDHLPVIVDIIENAFEKMQNELNGRSPSYKNHLSKSIRVNEQIKGRITDEYGKLVRSAGPNRFGLFIEGYLVLFKKLDKYGRPSNIKTRYSQLLKMQGRINFPGEPEIIYIGYVSDPGFDYIKKISAVKLDDQEVIWSTNLRTLVSKALVISKPPVIETDDLTEKVTAKAKKNKKAG